MMLAGADQYALAATAYHVLTGSPLYHLILPWSSAGTLHRQRWRTREPSSPVSTRCWRSPRKKEPRWPLRAVFGLR